MEKKKAAKVKAKKNRTLSYYKTYDMKKMEQYSLCDAIQYIQACQVGSRNAKYEVHVKLRTLKTSPLIRPNQIHLPHLVKSDVKYAVICPPDSPAAESAREAGAVLVGEENIFEQIKEGKFNFDRLLAHPQSLQKMGREGLPRILGPKGLMPNPKNGTISNNPGETIKQLTGGSLYRELGGVVRMAIGRLEFTPQQIRENLRAFIDRIKEDASRFQGDDKKEVNEVVLSSSKSPGFSLNGLFRSKDSPDEEQLSVA